MSGIVNRNGVDVIERNGIDYPVYETANAVEQSTRTATKVCIVGVSPTTCHDAPWSDDSYEIWTCSSAPFFAKRVTRHFELHEVESHREKWQKCGLWDAMKAVPRLVLQAPHPEFPNAEVYPIEQVLSQFPRYFTSSVAFMIAQAILERFEEIAIFGVDMATDEADGNSEYGHQRPCCEFLMGVARGMGIQVALPEGCDLLTAGRLYGYETNRSAMWQKIEVRERELKRKLNDAESRFEMAKREMHVMQGALSDLKYMRRFA